MKKLHTAIVFLALALFISCDEKVAKSTKESTKVIVKTKNKLIAEINKEIKKHGATANLNYIDTSQVTDMSYLFLGYNKFNGDISKWDTSSVTDMAYMFRGAKAFNQSLNNWNVSKVTNMSFMFYGAKAFNQNISAWANKSGRNIKNMFKEATAMQESNKPSWAQAR